MGRLEGKGAIVTGGTSGIGRACAARFAEEGARVVIAGRRREAGERVAASIPGVVFVAADVAREDDVRSVVEAALERFGRIDCVVSNAGGVSRTGAIVDTDPAAFDHDWAVHVRAAFLAMKYAAPGMIERGSGSFIHMSSISAHIVGLNTFGYEVAKAALVHLTRCAAMQLGEKGIRVNSISPGPVRTGIFAKAIGVDADSADEYAADAEAAFEALLPTQQALPGMIQPEDIANAAVFLASDDSRYVNGHDLVVDGGTVAGRPAKFGQTGWRVLAEGLQKAARAR